MTPLYKAPHQNLWIRLLKVVQGICAPKGSELIDDVEKWQAQMDDEDFQKHLAEGKRVLEEMKRLGVIPK